MIVITGGAGFIGSALLWGFNEAGNNNIAVVDRLGTENKWKNLVKRRFELILHRDQFFSWLEDKKNSSQIECVFHMGACSSTTEVDMDYLLTNNIQYTQKIFQFCTERKIPLIYASSAATYGLGEQGFSDDPAKIHTLKPINQYGYSKQVVDNWVLAKGKDAPPFWCGLKFFNVYGPGEYHKKAMMSLVAKGYPQLMEKGEMQLFKSHKVGFADGQQKRDFIYIKDIVKIMLHIWQHHKEIPSGIYNLGTGHARAFFDLGKAMFKAASVTENINFVDMPENIRNQYQYFTEAETSRLRTKVGYKGPFYSLEDGIGDYIRNYLSKEDCYL